MIKLTKNILVIFCFCFLCGCDQTDAKEATDKSNDTEDYYKIRVLTYNIQHGRTTSGDINLDLYAQIINEQEPDIVALQEVDNKAQRSGKIDITAELAQRTGLNGYFGKYRDYQGGEFGDAILTRYPVLDFKVIPANSTLHKVPRSYIFAKLKIADDTSVYFNNSHLSHRIVEQATIQAKELIDYWNNELNNAPLIIAGDLNSVPDSDAMQVLLEHFNVSEQSLKPTFSARKTPNHKIDYILYPKNQNWKVFETKVICEQDASDHCGILAVLGLKKEAIINE